MASERVPPDSFYVAAGNPTEHRRRVQQQADERAAQRGNELLSQASPMKDPQERIGIWERLHALRLPRSSAHVLVRVIARQTGLTVGQVHEEQQRRAGTPSQSPNASVTNEQRTEDSASIQLNELTLATANSGH